MTGTEKTAALAVLALSFGVYVMTATPLIAAGDAGELVSAAWLLGIPHPPGYPLFCMLGKLFSFIPIGNIAFRMNVMSGFFSALTALFVYLSGLELTRSEDAGRWPAALLSAGTALAVSFTGTHWSQATYSEVYPIQSALTAASVYAALRSGNRDFRYALFSCFLFGLSVVGHYAGMLLAPGLFVYLMFAFGGRWDFRKAAWCVLGVFAGLSAFLYILPRAAAGTPMNWDSPDTVAGFLRHVTRASYGDLFEVARGVFGINPVWYKNTAVMALAIAALIVAGLVAAGKRMGKPGWAKLSGVAVLYFSLIGMVVLAARGFTAAKLEYVMGLAGSRGWPAIAALSVAGCAYLFRKRRDAFYLLALTLAVTLTISVNRVAVGPGVSFQAFSEKFFIPTLVTAGMLAAAGLYGIRSLLAGFGPVRRPAAVALSLAALAYPAWLASANWQERDESGHYYAHEYSDNMFRGMEQDAVFMVEGDNVPSLMAYQKFVEIKRPDVGVYEITAHVFPPFEDTIPIYAEGKRPMYHSEAAEPAAFPGITMELSGMLSRFPGTPVRLADPWEYYSARIDRGAIAYADYPTREVIANYLYFRGLRLTWSGRVREAERDIEDAARAGHDMAWAQMLAGLALRDGLGKNERAGELLSRAAGQAPANASVFFELGKTYLMLGRPDEAARDLDKAKTLAPDSAAVYCLLAEAAAMKGDAAKAEGLRKRCAELVEAAEGAAK